MGMKEDYQKELQEQLDEWGVERRDIQVKPHSDGWYGRLPDHKNIFT